MNRLAVVTLFCAASGLGALACGGDDAATTGGAGAAGTSAGGSAGASGGGVATGGAAGSGTGGGGSSGVGGSTDGGVIPSDGGATDATPPGDGGIAMGKKRQAFAIASGGNVSKSQNYTLVSTMGQGAAMNGSSKSTNYRLNPGVVGATQK